MKNGRHLTVYVCAAFFNIVYLASYSWCSCPVEKMKRRDRYSEVKGERECESEGERDKVRERERESDREREIDR